MSTRLPNTWALRTIELKAKGQGPSVTMLEGKVCYRKSHLEVYLNSRLVKRDGCRYVLPGLKDVRIHDLRRTFGSYQAMTGASLQVIGKSLGHKSLAATQIYARMNLDPVRSSVEKAVELMSVSKAY